MLGLGPNRAGSTGNELEVNGTRSGCDTKTVALSRHQLSDKFIIVYLHLATGVQVSPDPHWNPRSAVQKGE